MKTCKRCGIEKPRSDYYSAGTKDGLRGECKGCNLAKQAEYYRANKSEYARRNKSWIELNRERHQAYQAEYQRQWKETSTGKRIVREKDHRLRAKRHGADQGCWYAREEYADLILGDRCSYCLTDRVEVDHIFPLPTSQDDTWSNLAPACRSCNSRKRNRDLLGFLLDRPEVMASSRGD